MKRNQRQWKGKQLEKKEVREEEKSRIREWTEEDNDEMGYHKLHLVISPPNLQLFPRS